MTWLRLKESDRDVIVNVSQIVAVKKEGDKSRITLASGAWIETSVDYRELIVTLRYEGEVTEIDGQ